MNGATRAVWRAGSERVEERCIARGERTQLIFRLVAEGHANLASFFVVHGASIGTRLAILKHANDIISTRINSTISFPDREPPARRVEE